MLWWSLWSSESDLWVDLLSVGPYIRHDLLNESLEPFHAVVIIVKTQLEAHFFVCCFARLLNLALDFVLAFLSCLSYVLFNFVLFVLHFFEVFYLVSIKE